MYRTCTSSKWDCATSDLQIAEISMAMRGQSAENPVGSAGNRKDNKLSPDTMLNLNDDG